MNQDRHIDAEELIDFLERELSLQRAREIDRHLETCDSCGSYLRSLERTYSLLAGDTVPELAPGYWAYFVQRVRRRIGSKRRRLVLVLAPGIAAVLVVGFLLWLGTRAPVPEVDGMELMLAEMSIGEMVESVSANPVFEEMFLEAAEHEISSLERYLVETEDIYDLVDGLTEAEKGELMSKLGELLNSRDGSSKSMTDFMGREC